MRRAGAAWLTSAACALLLILSGCASYTGSDRTERTATAPAEESAPRTPQPAGCPPAQVRPFTCNAYTVEYPSGDLSSFTAWVDVQDGRPRLVVGESERIRVLPLVLNSEEATSERVAGWKPLQRSCAPESECALDQLVEKVFTGGARVSLDGSYLRAEAGSAALSAVDTGRTHRYPQLGSISAGGQVLLTYRDDGAHLEAANGGRLSVNSAGCLTDGQFVLVLPDTTVLNDDGSIDIGGRHVPLGGRLHLGGGEGPVPADQRCGTGGYWYGWGA